MKTNNRSKVNKKKRIKNKNKRATRQVILISNKSFGKEPEKNEEE